MKKKQQQNDTRVLEQNELVQIMSRVGEPSMVGESNVSFYNMIAPIYASPSCRYTDPLKPGYQVRKDTINNIVRNRCNFMINNISRNIMISLFSTIFDPNEFFKDKFEFEQYTINWFCPWDLQDIDTLLSERSPLLDLSTTTDYAVGICTRIYNSIMHLVGNRILSDDIYAALTQFMGKTLDFITYQLCLYKIEAITIYKNAISIDEDAEEALARKQEIDKRVNLSELVSFVVQQNAELCNMVKSQGEVVSNVTPEEFYRNLSFKESPIKGSKKTRNQISRARDYDDDDDMYDL